MSQERVYNSQFKAEVEVTGELSMDLKTLSLPPTPTKATINSHNPPYLIKTDFTLERSKGKRRKPETENLPK